MEEPTMSSYVEVNPRSLLIRVENQLQKKLRSKATNRGEIKCFSYASMRRLSRLLLNNGQKFKLFFTVTYRRNQTNVKISKKHLDRFLTRLRKLCGANLGYVWALEFQSRGAVHFHFFFTDVEVKDFEQWQRLPVRRKVRDQFRDEKETLERFKFLTYLWLRVTGQLDDPTTVRTSCTLMKINDEGFAAWYAAKYMAKMEQKVYIGNIDETTGEVVDMWQGRYWGASRNLRNEKVYRTLNYETVRAFRKWFARAIHKKRFSGLWLFKNKDKSLANRVLMMCRQLDRLGYSREDESMDEKVSATRHALSSVTSEADYTEISSAKVLRPKKVRVPSRPPVRHWQETEGE